MTVVGPAEAVSVEFRHMGDRLARRFGWTVPPCMVGELVDEAVRQFEVEGAARYGTG